MGLFIPGGDVDHALGSLAGQRVLAAPLVDFRQQRQPLERALVEVFAGEGLPFVKKRAAFQVQVGQKRPPAQRQGAGQAADVEPPALVAALVVAVSGVQAALEGVEIHPDRAFGVQPDQVALDC